MNEPEKKTSAVEALIDQRSAFDGQSVVYSVTRNASKVQSGKSQESEDTAGIKKEVFLVSESPYDNGQGVCRANKVKLSVN